MNSNTLVKLFNTSKPITPVTLSIGQVYIYFNPTVCNVSPTVYNGFNTRFNTRFNIITKINLEILTIKWNSVIGLMDVNKNYFIELKEEKNHRTNRCTISEFISWLTRHKEHIKINNIPVINI